MPDGPLPVIYGLREKGASDYFYVGSTKRKPAIRLRQHLKSAQDRSMVNRHLQNKILKIGIPNVEIEVLEVATPADRFECEYRWITKLREQGARLTNIQLTSTTERHHAKTKSDWQKYLDQIFTLAHVLTTLDYLERPVIAQNPRFQAIALELHKRAVNHLKTLITDCKTAWFEKLGITEECELSDTIQTRIRALPSLS